MTMPPERQGTRYLLEVSGAPPNHRHSPFGIRRNHADHPNRLPDSGEPPDAAGAAEAHTAVLDHGSAGRLLGIEVFGARRRLHPELLETAERIDREPGPPSG
ncbi:hypothetical protein [Streptomyces sp. NPDC000961]|uniref:hypothetical protein n=1 Tax=Streptomyces sp. NPDC000961 TaxID=3364541 RepID=UPI0036941463